MTTLGQKVRTFFCAGFGFATAFGLLFPSGSLAQSENDPEILNVLRTSGIPSHNLRRIGNWIITEKAVDDILPACSITAAFRNGLSVTLAGGEGSPWSMTLRRAPWRKGDFDDTAIHFWVDEENPQRAYARANDRKRTLTFPIYNSEWPIINLRNGRQLTLAVTSTPIRFPLTHIHRAVGWVQDCMPQRQQRVPTISNAAALVGEQRGQQESGSQDQSASWLRLTSKGTPKEPLTTSREYIPPARSAPQPEPGSAAMEFLLELLATANIPNADLNPPDDRRRWGIGINATWRTAEAYGAIRHYKALSGDLYHMESRLLVLNEAQRCGRQFESGVLSSSMVGLSGTFTRCIRGDGANVRLHLRMEGPDEDTFLILVGASTENGETLPAVAPRLANAARQISAGWN